MQAIADMVFSLPSASVVGRGRSSRDPRVDVLRGAALLMIFVDHVPKNALNLLTLHEFGFCDAAEIFVLLAGFSAMTAYGKALEKDVRDGLRRIAARCLRIYLTHVALLVVMLAVGLAWLAKDPSVAPVVAPLSGLGARGIFQAMSLQGMPAYLDILPLYIVLLALFPLVWFAARRGAWPTLALSGAVWAVAGLWHGVNLPNTSDPNGWYFNPFAWQFLFTIGSALAILARHSGGDLPRRTWMVALCVAYVVFAFVECWPWSDWGPAALRPLVMAPPDKSHLSFWRIFNILAIIYLVMSSARCRGLAEGVVGRAFGLCGRHSLEVFALGCVLALVGRLAMTSFGAGGAMQVMVNVAGIAGMLGVAAWRERRRAVAREPRVPAYDVAVFGGD